MKKGLSQHSDIVPYKLFGNYFFFRKYYLTVREINCNFSKIIKQDGNKNSYFGVNTYIINNLVFVI